jgi:hypothetical protein
MTYSPIYRRGGATARSGACSSGAPRSPNASRSAGNDLRRSPGPGMRPPHLARSGRSVASAEHAASTGTSGDAEALKGRPGGAPAHGWAAGTVAPVRHRTAQSLPDPRVWARRVQRREAGLLRPHAVPPRGGTWPRQSGTPRPKALQEEPSRRAARPPNARHPATARRRARSASRLRVGSLHLREHAAGRRAGCAKTRSVFLY